jgi:hypothetical protein
MIRIPQRFQKPRFACLGLLLAALFLFAWFTWPLPRYATRGIVSSHRPEVGAPRYVIPGDHLQLLYHFDLMKGFLTGRTPWFHNLYEFNVGNDADTLHFDMYYAPFSWFYTLAALGGNMALGWNFAGFASMFFSLAGTWLLVRRFPAPLPVQLAASLIGVGLPYRWITFLHGSPTGFAMMYVPWLLYGLHLAVVDRKTVGGWLAGASLILAAWGDIHTFFFMGLLTPLWALFVFFLQEKPDLHPKELFRLGLSLRGFIVCGLIVVLQAVFIRLYLTDGTMARGRTLQEILLFAHRPSGLLDRNPGNPHNEIYLTWSGLILVLTALVSGLITLCSSFTRQRIKNGVLLLSMFMALAGVVILSTGPRAFGEFSHRYWGMLTRMIPPYAMIRQTSKIFAILPSLLAVFVVFPFRISFAGLSDRKWIGPVFLSLSLVFLLESGGRLSPTISLLQKGSPAYAAIRDNAEELGVVPRALAVVLWPGDAHWTSVNQFFAIQYGIRLVNGYKPNVPAGYREEIFYQFKPLNQGFADDQLLDDLLNRGVNHLILHEDAFPEQVSPFSVGTTLSALLANPRIRVLKQDRQIWAFEILPEADETHRIKTGWNSASSARLWHLTRFIAPEASPAVHDPSAFREHLVRLAPEDPPLSIPIGPTYSRESLRLLLRVRGEGTLASVFTTAQMTLPEIQTPVQSEGWEWIEVFFPEFEGFHRDIRAHIRAVTGSVDMDLGSMQLGPSTLDLSPGQTHIIYPPTLFRAGYSDLEQNAVVFLPDRAPHSVVAFGPRLVFPEGLYRATLHYETEPSSGDAGQVRVSQPPSSGTAAHSMPSDKDHVVLEFAVTEAYPLLLEFTFFRNSRVQLNALEIHRVE